MKEYIRGYLEWSNSVQNVNIIVTPVTSGFVLLLNYFHLIPQTITWINYLLAFIYLVLYTSLFTTIVLTKQKKQHERNLKKLREDIEELRK